MKIGIDFDGVILDSQRNINFYADFWSTFELKKSKLKDEDLEQECCFGWTKEEKKRFFDKHYDKISKNSEFIVGAKEILTILKNEGHELYLVTARGQLGEEETNLAKEKLDELGVEFDMLCWSSVDKVSKCKELGINVMIDDNPKNVEQFKDEENIKVLYFQDNFARSVDMKNVIKVDSWMDIYQEIFKLSKI